MSNDDYTFTFLTDYDVDFSEDEPKEEKVISVSSPPPQAAELAPVNRSHDDSLKPYSVPVNRSHVDSRKPYSVPVNRSHDDSSETYSAAVNKFSGGSRKSEPKKTNEKQMPKKDFEKNLTELLKAFGEVLKKQDGLFGDFVIDEVELGLGITASIGIAIVSGGVESSFKIKFKRK